MDAGLWLTALLMLGFLCQWAAWRLRLPAILFLLLAGLGLGPISGAIDPGDMMSELLFPLVQLGVAIILFEGSLTLRFSQIRTLAPAILLLVTVGALITVVGLAWAANQLAGLSWPIALLFGALNCVTGPTVIAPLLRSVRPNERIAKLLRWEGIIIDPLGALLAVIAAEAILLGGGQFDDELLLHTITVGTVIGLIAGIALAMVIRRRGVPDYLENYLVLAALLAAFSIANVLAHEAGLLAVTVMGITMANFKGLDIEHILHFKENLSTLVISLMFLVLSARIDTPSLEVLAAGIGILLFAMLVVRPVAVFVSTLFSPLTFADRAMVAYISPRGIVAAAVSALFALRLEEQGIDGAQELVALTFIMIIGTVLIQSATAGRVARRLNVMEPEAKGVLIVGSSELPRRLAIALKKLEIPVTVADDDWAGIRRARMDGLNTYFGNPVSEHAAATLPLNSTRWMLAFSTRMEMNSLACMRYLPEFGKHFVLRIRLLAAGDAPRVAHAAVLQVPALFGKETTHASLSGLLEAGWEIRMPKISEEFSWKQFVQKFEETPNLLFAVDERNKLRFTTERESFTPKPGWRVVCLCGEEVQHEAEEEVAEAVPEPDSDA